MDYLEIDRITRPERRASHSQAHHARLVVAPGDFAATSPFLLMAEDWFEPPAGFPDHPHRGLQTVTIVLDGALEHRDHAGGRGALAAGDVQWMTAGRGVIHSEMPAEGGVHTLQLWLNLPAEQKMAQASYRDQSAARTPVSSGPGYEVRVYAGRHDEAAHPHASLWPLMLLDARVAGGKRVELEVPAGYRAFLYVLSGRGRLEGDDTAIGQEQVVWFKPARSARIVGLEADERLRALLFAGPTIDEPVVAHGPFVMNTAEEIRQAYADYRAGRLAG